MKKIILFFMLILLVGCAKEQTISEESKEPLIGGDRDEHGCLGPAGYTWNGTAGACIREWELNENQVLAAKKAVDYVGWEYATTITEVYVVKCPGCFVINLEKEEQYITIRLDNWEVDIYDFIECIAAGNPVMESYPRQCKANGKTFVEEITSS